MYICSAANSGDFIIGIGKSFWSVIGVFIKPGLIKVILTFFFFISKWRLSVKLDKADLDAQYAPAAGKPLYPATEETIDIWPLFLLLK